MKKFLTLLLTSLLLGCSSFHQVQAEPEDDFVATDLIIRQYNSRSIQYNKTLRGVRIERTENMPSVEPDPFLRFDSINDTHAVSVKNHKYIAVRYRCNYDPDFALRIKSTTGAKDWSDFRFSSAYGHQECEVGTWKTYVCPLKFENASSVELSEYERWEDGDYLGVSFNVVNIEKYSLSESYLYISSFAFFSSEEEANSYYGLDYTKNLDTEGPEISIPFGDGETFKITAGKSRGFYAEAYDEYDDVHSVVEGELSSGALDENNKFVEGNHTVTFVASDYSGNETTKILNLIVLERDAVPPVINCNIETIYVQTGTYNCLSFTAYDEIDGEIKCELLYSENAVDSKNRFLEGNHTLTISATDLTGNRATKDISIIVGNEFNPNGLEVITESK